MKFNKIFSKQTFCVIDSSPYMSHMPPGYQYPHYIIETESKSFKECLDKLDRVYWYPNGEVFSKNWDYHKFLYYKIILTFFGFKISFKFKDKKDI